MQGGEGGAGVIFFFANRFSATRTAYTGSLYYEMGHLSLKQEGHDSPGSIT